MVRILTAHRVFPAKVTGGNGIAGTSVVPSYCLNNTLKAAGAAMAFLLNIKLYKTVALTFLYDGVMIGPGGFETVREQFYGSGALAVPYQ
jgi:hypothetical protein